jgi:hypothetical protein
MRVFVPLHMRGSHDSGRFKIKPLRATNLPIDYSVVSKSNCGERLLVNPSKFEVLVNPGPPQVIIQDNFTVDTPTQVILSNNNNYRLEIFNRTYRVYENRENSSLRQCSASFKEIASYDPNRLLNTPTDDLVTYLAEK